MKLKIPLAFAESRLGELTWHDIRFGLENELLAPDAPEQLAVKRLERPEETSSLLVDLITTQAYEDTVRIVAELAEADKSADARLAAAKWLYLSLAWLYERRFELDDPLQHVEIAYADFGYPERIAGLVRYMPSREASQLGPGETGLLRLWERFLSEERERLLASS